MIYQHINEKEVLSANYNNIRLLLRGHLSRLINQETIKELNKSIFAGIAVKNYTPGTFRQPSQPEDFNISSRILKSQDDRQIYSMRSLMNEKALQRFDNALALINPENLKHLTTKEFTQQICSIYATLDYTHPFQDGNSRTFRTFTQMAAKDSGFKLDWQKIASNQYLRDELYCARSIEVNRLAIVDPDQSSHKEFVNNMLEDLSDKRDLAGLFVQQKIITPYRALDFKHEIQNCFNFAKNSPDAFKSAFKLSCLNLSKRHPEIDTALKQINSAIDTTIKNKEDIKGYQVSAHIILPAFYTLLDKGYQSISQEQFKAAMGEQITLIKQRENQSKTHNKSTPHFTLFLIAGPNGSGKTSEYEILRDSGIIKSETKFINPDEYAKKLANQYGFSNVNELPVNLKASVDIQAAKMALNERAQCFKRKQDMIIETTASSRGTIKLIEEAKAKGYHVETHFVTLKDVALNNLRIQKRAAEGGHFVAPEIVERRFAKALELMPEIFAKSDIAALIDNSKNHEKVLSKDSKSIKIFPNENWTTSRLNNLAAAIKKFEQDINKHHDQER